MVAPLELAQVDDLEQTIATLGGLVEITASDRKKFSKLRARSSSLESLPPAEDTAVGHWARSRQFPDYFLPGDTAGLSQYIARLREPDFVRERVQQALHFARGEFAPENIQRQFVESLSLSTL